METALTRAANQVWAGLRGIAEVTPYGLDIKDQIDIDDFRKAFNLLIFMDDRYKVFINFALGDLYNALDLKHGEKKAQILDTWGEGWYNRLATLGKVARAVPKLCRHNYQLSWHVYEAFSLKSIPADVRESGLAAAADMKANGKYLSRETIRQSTDIYKPPKKAAAGPKWNGGNGGSFGAQADQSESESERGDSDVTEETNELQTTDAQEAGRQEARAMVEGLDGGEPSSLEAETQGLRESPAGAGGLGLDGDMTAEEWEEAYCKLNDSFHKVAEQRNALSAECRELRSEVSSLKAKLAGNLIEISDSCLQALDREVERRRLKSPYDATIERDTVAEDLLTRAINRVEADRKRPR